MIAGPDGWRLAPEGAAVREAERVAILADIHLGYEWARASRGDVVPAHSLAETLAKLARLLARVRIDRLIVAGDLLESPSPCARTARDVRGLTNWLVGRGVELVRLRGNHDPHLGPATLEVAGWTIGHGHAPIAARRLIVGHHHPALKVEGRTFPCFLIGPTTIALPAFSPNAAGFDVGSGFLPEPLRREPLRCVAGTGSELLDFGPLASLAARLRGT